MLLAALAAAALAGCGASEPPGTRRARDETAAERARREHAASGEAAAPGEGRSWGGWRYQGARDDCFYLVGRTCYAALDDACAAAGCGGDAARCRTRGGGPALVSCRK